MISNDVKNKVIEVIKLLSPDVEIAWNDLKAMHVGVILRQEIEMLLMALVNEEKQNQSATSTPSASSVSVSKN